MTWAKHASFIVATLWLAVAHCASVSPEEAHLAVENWLGEGDALGCAMGAVAGDAQEYAGTDGTGAFYVVPLANGDGTKGGFVVVSADTLLPPVMAFSDAGEFVESADNPLFVLLSADAARAAEVLAKKESGVKLLAKSSGDKADDVFSRNEEKWAKLLARRSAKALLKASAPSDLRVDALLGSRWNQQGAGSDYCYNYYTPNHYPCGCVATALGQLLYYWKRPTDSVTTLGNYYYSIDGVGNTTPQGTVFGPWDWSAMADRPSSSTQRKAVGRLCADLGLLVDMNYAPNESGTAVSIVDRRLAAELGFVSKQLYYNNKGIDVGALKKAVVPCLEAGCPVILGLSGSTGGHAVVGDGYGYSSGEFYMHLNMGWGGSGDSWYAPPNVSAGGHTYTSFDTIIYNIYPEGIAWGTIFTGRVFDSSGAALAGQRVTAHHRENGETFSATTKSNGTFVFTLPGNGEYEIAAERDGLCGARTIVSEYCISCDTANGGAAFYTDDEGVGWNNSGARRNESKNEYDLDLTVNRLCLPMCLPASGTVFDSDEAAVMLLCASSGATIRYTTDGSEPTEASTAYSGAILLGEGSFTIKAKAFKSGCEPSETITATYTNPPRVAMPTLTPISAMSGATSYLMRRFTFTLGCELDGADIRYTLDGNDPTQESALYTGAIELNDAVGELRTIKVRAFRDGYRPSEVLSMEVVRTQPERWIDERPETHEGTGWWWPERTDFAADGLLHFAGDYYYHANEPAAERCATIDVTISFDAPDEVDDLRLDDDTKAAVRIGPEGGFQLFTRLRDGSRGWIDVAAQDVPSVANREYTFRFRLDSISCMYTAAVLSGGDEVPLIAGRRFLFPFACGMGDVGGTREVAFIGVGRLRAILGECSRKIISDAFKVILR